LTEIGPRELERLYGLSRTLVHLARPGEIAETVLGTLQELTGGGLGTVWLRVASGELLVCAAARGGPPTDGRPVVLSAEWIEFLIRGGPILLSETASRDSVDSRGRLPPLPDGLADRRPTRLLPLIDQGELLGIITLSVPPTGEGTPGTGRQLLGEIAGLTAGALSRSLSLFPIPAPEGPTAASRYRDRYPTLRRIVGDSRAVVDLYRNLLAVAPANFTVLLIGETGVGKELAARVLHELSARRDSPFVELDCGAVPESLIESELFGHAKGAFTGATHDRRGVFELAHGGTLFLDEVTNLPIQTQNRLLRVLQEHRFRPVGGEETVEVDVRVVAAANRDLRLAVDEGTFREDLFYRLYVFPIRVPPLRERREDIPLLAAHYLELCARENGISPPPIDESFTARLRECDFPGNVRELRHLIERTLLRSRSRGTADASLLDEYFQQELPRHPSPAGPGPPDAFPRRAGVERGMWVLEVLRDHRFNVKVSAETLTAMAHRNPDHPPPLTDRSSLTYYFQVECFRLFLECRGNLDEATRAIAGEAEGSVRTVHRRLAGYLNSARLVLEGCPHVEEARRTLRGKFLKLPEDYLTVLDQLADHLWQPPDRPLAQPVPGK
jgi:transcriptional regulator with GAF, ATPase, and Fis domain